MYFLELIFENSRHNGYGSFRFRKRENSRTIAKWTNLGPNKAASELLTLITIGLAGDEYLNAIPVSTDVLKYRLRPLRVACVLTRHYPLDIETDAIPLLGSGVRVDTEGHVASLRSRELDLVPPRVPVRKLNIGKRLSAYFLLAYGKAFRPGPGDEDFYFTDPLFRRTRFHSLLMPDSPLTHPAEFIERLRYKGIRCGRTPSRHVLYTLCTQLSQRLHMATASWMDVAVDPNAAWNTLHPWQQRAALPILDMARHMMDAFSKCVSPLEMPGVVLMDHPESFCTPKRFKDYLTLLDTLFPNIQFIIATGTTSFKSIPVGFWKKRLPLPKAHLPQKQSRPVRLPRDTILLIDVDGRLPNLALMKLSAHYRSKGHKVWLGKRDCFIEEPDRVYASTLLYCPNSERRNHRLRSYYADKLTLGGTGEDITSRLPDTVEAMEPDYTLYPELGDRAIGFITRGCPFSCPFCVVPPKEGQPRQVSDLDTLLEGGRRKKLILLDDNILSHPDADRLLMKMAERSIMVNFTQTLDLRLINRDRAKLLRKVQCSNTRFTRRNFHFSLNNNRNLEPIARKYKLFNFKSEDNVEFICMYGYDTTIEEDVDRLAFLRSLPGAYVFMQKYMALRDGPSPDKLDFFGHDPDRVIDQLISIVFTQNMKSVENYYRWVSNRYARTYGKLHLNLVDAIFRYNNRHKKGEYIASLAGTKNETD